MGWFDTNVDEKLKEFSEEKEQQKLERQARQDKEYVKRFRLDNKPNSYNPMTAEVIILDSSLSTPSFHEYALDNIHRKPNSTDFTAYEVSCENIAGSEDPLAGQQIGQKKAKSYFAQFFTVLNCTPLLDFEKDASGKYVVKKDAIGNPVLKKNEDGSFVYQKMLLCVKQGQLSAFREKFKKWIEKNGTLRGCKFRLTRTGEDKSPVIGNIDTLDEDTVYKFLTEQELIQQYGHPEVKDKEGNVVKEANLCLKPFQYITEPNGHKADIFKWPNADEQRKKWNLGTVSGSKASNSWIQEAKEQEQTQQPAAAPVEEKIDHSNESSIDQDQDIPF